MRLGRVDLYGMKNKQHEDELFRALSRDADMDWVFIDGSIVRAHQHSCGVRTADNESIGQSRGGNSTKIHLAVDSGWLSVYYESSCGNTYDIVHAESLVANCPTSNIVVADYYERNIYKYLL